MRRRSPVGLFIAALLLGMGLIVALVIGNYRYTRQNPGGTDFLVHWVGTQSFLDEGLSPYSDEVALRIQEMVYGHPAQAGEHELRVAYPLYSILLFIPFALVHNFELARALWMTVLEIALIAMTFLSLNMVRWRPKPIMLALLLLFSVFWYHALRPVILGNAIVLVALLVLGAIMAVRDGHDELAGILLGFASIKPQVIALFVVFILFWGVSNRRLKVFGYFLGTVVLLSGIAALLIPDWIFQNLREIMRYPGYNPPGTLASALNAILPAAGNRIGKAISVLMGIDLLVEWFLTRKAGVRGFLWAASLTMMGSFWIGIQTDPGNFIFAYPALIFVFSVFLERWQKSGTWIIVTNMILLMVAIWAIFLKTVEYTYQPVQSPVMFFPLPLYLLISLYWIRWWALHPSRLDFDTFLEKSR